MVNQVVKTTEKLAPVVETIFHWRSDDDSHCLLRVYVDEQNSSAVVVASKLYSETPRENHLSADFEQLVLAINTEYEALLSPLSKVDWIAHYGLFSVVYSFENLHTTESFSRITLPWPLPRQLLQYDGKWWGLRPAEEENIRSQILLEPVEDILKRLSSDQ